VALNLVLVRHGETAWSATGRHTGATDLELTADGRARSAWLRGALDRRGEGDRDPFAHVLTSPRRRATETASIAGFGADARADAGAAEVEVDPDLAEWDYGAYEGRTTADIRAERPGWTLWRDGVPDGESLADVVARADRVLARLEGVEGDVLCFSHGHFLRVLAARWLGLPGEDGRLLALGPSSLSVLGHEREQPVITSWNDLGPPPPPPSPPDDAG
jgi:probable phosphoglycerate mutase